MDRLQLLKTLYRHTKLSEKRSVAWEQNRIAKYGIYIMSSLTIAYLVFIAVIVSLAVNDSESVTGYEFMYGILPFILTFDFLLRFAIQQTPSQLVKPYSLLPISKFACIDCFLFNTLISTYNLFWFAFYVPFTIMSVIFSEGIAVSLGFLLGLWLLTLINSQWYLLVRSLMNTSIKWLLLPIAVYALLFSPLYMDMDVARLCETYMVLGEGFSFWNPLYYISTVAVLALLLETNRRMQYRLVWKEISKTEQTKVKHLIRLSFLDDKGETGEYLRLEIKSIMRNKNLRKTFILGTLIIVLFSLLLSFTSVYDGIMMTNFWCLYCFALYGAMILVKVMCYEGNYIDCLMVRKENIIHLLRAKYYLYSALLLLPLILMLPTVFTGKCSFLMLLSYAVFTSGVEYCMFLQMAVYNKQTIPLNTKFVGKGSMETNYMQLVVEILVFTVPISFISIAKTLLDEFYAHLIILLLGLVFIVSHRVWIRNIYTRMMRRRYANMDGFRASR